MAGQDGIQSQEEDLSSDIKDQDKQHVKEKLDGMDHSGGTCKPYPFGCYHDPQRYIEDSILEVTEAGASDLIEPCHEFKAFVNAKDETRMGRFTYEVIRFASACMNNRTNGTIHFGIGDKPDFRLGQVLGVVVDDKEAYVNALKIATDACIERKHKLAAQTCIKPPRFVGVLNKNWTSSEKYVIEVDIDPDSNTCKEDIFHIFNIDKKAKRKGKELVSQSVTQQSKHFFVRDGSSSRDLLAKTTFAKPMAEYQQFITRVPQLFQCRKQAEEKHLNVIKNCTQGSILSHMITGGTLSLDDSNFQQYVIVTNKSHSIQFESLGFLAELNPTAVLDFDPESAEHGLQRHFAQKITVNVHSPARYKITKPVQDIAEDLKLTQGTSWVFCNGGIEDESPSDIDQWLKEKGSSVQDVVSFLCQKDVLTKQRFLVVFLLLSTVNEKMDPLVETFITFYKELQGKEQILCLCENEKAFTSWRDLLEARCRIDISDRCIYELSFAEVNGTVLSLLSENCKSSRFLPCGGRSKVLLEKKVEQSLNTLEILCVNQCEGGNNEKLQTEENFYKGGKVSWWNFYFSEEPGSKPFIKRDMFDYIIDTVIPGLCSQTKACVVFHLLHVPGCGGTTLAMHTLWALRQKFRCAVLRKCNAEFAEVADQVIKLLTNDHKEQIPRVPVLLMLDEFDNKKKVSDLQQLIEMECVNKGIRSKTALVILLNCMRSESPAPTEQTGNTVFIGNNLSDKEQRLFEEKLKEIEETHKNAETFYGFMIMKKNFKSEYVEGVARNTLKSFDMSQKHAQLLAVLVLLDVYCKGSALSISLCEEFLDLKPKPFCGSVEVEEGFGKFSPLIARCFIENGVVFKGVKIIHSTFAQCCLQELGKTHKVSKADVANFLLTTETLYQSTQGNDKLLHAVRQILVRGTHSVEEDRVEESQFSPLIRDIADETPGQELMVLQNASKRFEKDFTVLQLLARYCDLKKKDFSEAEFWAQEAQRARELCNNSSDTACAPGDLFKQKRKIAPSKMNSFKEVQYLVKEEAIQQFYFQRKRIQKGFQSFFCQCRKLFCIPSYQYLSEDNVPNIHQLNQARQFLEIRKADTYSGILSCLTNDSSPEAMEDIAKAYDCLRLSHYMPTVKEKVNFIYANVVLGCVKPESPHVQSYQKLVCLLCQILREPFSKMDYLPLYFIAVVLLWPHQNQSSPECRYLGEYISLMRTAYRSEIAKNPALHFFLGKKQGYEQLVHLKEIKKCVTDEQLASVWVKGKIWKEEKVEELLYRAEGEVKGDLILADTCIQSMKIKIPPLLEGELRERAQGSRVSFFIGFSMKGPVALDID